MLGYNHGSCFCLVQLFHQSALSAVPQILQYLSQAGRTWSPKPPPLTEPTTLLGQLNTRGTPSAQFTSARSLPPLLNVWWAVSEAVNIARDGVTAVTPWRNTCKKSEASVCSERTFVKEMKGGREIRLAEASAYVFNNREWTVIFGREPWKSEGIIL